MDGWIHQLVLRAGSHLTENKGCCSNKPLLRGLCEKRFECSEFYNFKTFCRPRRRKKRKKKTGEFFSRYLESDHQRWSVCVEVPVSARVWLRPHAALTMALSARESISLGASTRLVSPWPNWPLSLRPWGRTHAQIQPTNAGKRMRDNSDFDCKIFSVPLRRLIENFCNAVHQTEPPPLTPQRDAVSSDGGWCSPQLHSLPSVVMRRLWAAQGPDTTQLTSTSFRLP